MALTNLALTDDKIGPVTCAVTSLAVGASTTCTATGTAIAGQYTNTGCAVGTAPTGSTVTACDPDNYYGQTPAIKLIKKTNGTDNDVAPGVYVAPGATVTWTYDVTNTGNVALTDVTVTDDKLAPTAISCPATTLAVGASMQCTATGTAIAGQYTNTGTTTGKPPVGPPVTDKNPDNYYGQTPSITLIKKTNGTDNNTAPGVYVATGSTVTWTYLVTNTGNVALTNLVLTDDKIGAVSCPVTSLAVGASTTCTATGTAIAGQYTNTGTVTGKPPVGPNVTAADPDNYYGQTPSVTIVKKTNGTDNNAAPGVNVAAGSTVTWTYLVTNTGNVTLTNLALTDDKIGPVSCPVTSLAAGASTTCTKTGTAVAGQYVNNGCIVGTTPTGSTVNACDPDHYFGHAPAISIVKKTNGTDNNTAPGLPVITGTTVTWTYLITNTGNVPLTAVTLTDNKIGAIGCPATTLAVGANMTCTATGTAIGGQYTNLGTVTGQPPIGTPVTASDPDNYFGSIPNCSVVGYRTQTQGGWGAGPSGNNPGAFLHANFASVYPNGVTIGGTKWLMFTSAAAVTTFLPQGGTPVALTGSQTNPTNANLTVFAGQVLALRISVDMSAAGKTKSGLGGLVLVSGPLAGQTINQVLALANQVLGGAAPPSGMSISTLNDVVDTLNNNFVDGTQNNNAVNCPGAPPPAVGSLSGYVYVDANNNGVKDSGETPIANVSVTLSGSASKTTTTDAAGFYAFTTLAAGTYTITETQPAAYLDGIDTQGTPGTGTVGNDVFNNISLTAGTDGTNNNFGERTATSAITIVKKTNGTDNNMAPGVYVVPGSTVTWTYLITNTGNVPLTAVTLTDNKIGAISCPATSLAAGASMTCVKTGTAIAGQYTNIGTVTGTPPTGPNVTAADPDNYYGQNAAITLIKLTNGTNNDTGTGPLVAVGSTVTWTYTVTNSGNVPLTAVTVTDNKITGPICTIASLAVGASQSCTKTGIATVGQYENLGSVTGNPPSGPPVTATNPDHYFGVLATVRIQKISVGGTGAFNFTDTVPGGPTAITTTTAGTAAGVTVNNVATGTYTVTETSLPTGWTFTSLSCTGGGANTTTTGQTATIGVDPGESIVCTFTNTKAANNVGTGDTATIGYWQNQNGQALILAVNGGGTSKAFGNWLASNFPYLYGANSAYNLAGKTNADVAARFITVFKSGESPKTTAQVMANAIAIYVTNSTLAGGTYAGPKGFNVSTTGTGAKLWNVGSLGTAIGLQNNASYTVSQILMQANVMKAAGTFNAGAFNTICEEINRLGDIK